MPDWLNPATWVTNVVLGMANLLFTTYTNLVNQIIQLLFMTALPTPEKIANSWAIIGMGATYGVAAQTMGAVAVIVAFIVVLTPRKNHGRKLGRSLTSLFMVLLFGVMFFPVYGMAYSLSQGLVQGLLNIANSSADGSVAGLTNLFKTVFPEDPFGKLMTVILADIFGMVTFIEALALQGILLVTLVFYPLVLALRPLGGIVTGLFNLMNAALVTVLLSPPIMGIGFVAPVLVHNLVPGGTLPFASAVVTIIGGIFAAVTPIVLAVLTLRKSAEVFGNLDATVAGKLDINSMPPITLDDARRSVNETHRSSLLRTTFEIGTGIVGIADIADDESLFGTPREALQTTLKAAGVIATASGHPEVGAMATTAGSYLQSRHKTTPSASTPNMPHEQHVAPPAEPHLAPAAEGGTNV